MTEQVKIEKPEPREAGKTWADLADDRFCYRFLK